MWTVARAFAPGQLAIEADDSSRVVVAGDVTHAAVSSVSTAPFQAIDAAATRTLLDRIVAAWAEGDAAAFAAARATIDELGEDAFGNLVLVRLAEAVGVTWIGGGGAWLLVGGEAVSVARRHSLRDEVGPAAPDVPTRGLGGSLDEPETVTWVAPPEARVVCASWTIARLSADLVARLATGDHPARAAHRLVETAIRREPRWPAVAIVADRVSQARASRPTRR
jgi:hypothetical protein